MKLNFIVILITACSTIIAYDVRVFNKTDGDIEVRMYYGTAEDTSACFFQDYVIEKDKQKTLRTGICCPDEVLVRPITGIAIRAPKSSRKWSRLFSDENKIWLWTDAMSISGGVICKSFDVTVKNLASGELIAEYKAD